MMNKLETYIQTHTQTIQTLFRGIAIVSLGFCIILSVLVVANFVQLQTQDPLGQEAIQVLMERLEENPEDAELREQIRGLDLLARKAYFGSQWQIKVGSYLLLAGFALLVISIKIVNHLNQKAIILEDAMDEEKFWLFRMLSRKWILVAGGAAIFIFFLGITTPDRLSFKQAETKTTKQVIQTDFNPNSWPNFRGPGGNGVISISNPPTQWNAETGTNIVWTVTPPKPGFSSPVIWEDKIFVTGGDENGSEIYGYASATGDLLWTYVVQDIPGSTKLDEVYDDTGYAPSTVATDGSSVCAIFPNGDLVSVTLKGEKQWAINLGLPDNHYGHSSSLLIHQNLLIVQFDQNSASKLLAFQAATGEKVWEVVRGVISWSSPICVHTGERYELILTNSEAVYSYDPVTGTLLWENECLGGEMGPSAAYANGMVFAACDYAVAVALRVKRDGSELVWEYDENLPDTASPLATDKYVFILTSYGVVVCLDAKSGEMLWEQEFDDGFYASPILVEDLVYAVDLQGMTHIFKAADSYQAVGTGIIGEPCAATPAFVGERMYIRGFERLYCIGG